MIESKLNEITAPAKRELSYPVLMRHGDTVVLFVSAQIGARLTGFPIGEYSEGWIPADRADGYWTPLGPNESITLRNAP
jgi:hypothetical protein